MMNCRDCEFRRQYSFNPEEHRDKIVGWLKKTGERQNFDKVVIGISGGKDSAIAAALCCRAFGNQNVFGILLPDGLQSDIDDSIKVCQSLGIMYSTINIQPIKEAMILQYRMFNYEVDGEPGVITPEAMLNIGPRIRMTMLRLWAQSHHHRLCGTSNLSEITVGYCTKDGDTSCDFNPLAGLTSVEVVEIGKTLQEIPSYIVNKTPADGLSGVSDEEKLGVTYEDIHKYIRNIPMDADEWRKIHKRDIDNLHKHSPYPRYIPEL